MATRIEFESRSPTLRIADLSATKQQLRSGTPEVLEFTSPPDSKELHLELYRRTEKNIADDIFSKPLDIEVHYKTARLKYADGKVETNGYLEGRDWWRHAYSFTIPGGVLRLPADERLPERDRPLDLASMGIPHTRGTDVRVSIKSADQSIFMPILYVVT